MFDTLGSFSVVYFILATILILLVVFEKQCLRLEAKFDAKIRKARKAKAQKNREKNIQQNRQRPQSTRRTQQNPRVYRNPGNFAA